MRDDLIIQPDLTLILGPEDEAHFLGHAAARGQGSYYAVVHRRHGLWTHLYRVAQDRTPGRLLVHFEAFFAGDCPGAARAWLLSRNQVLPIAPSC
ncbi:MAG TPA: hypothetical protein VM661_17930 [Candidatus Sulfotelmatobacter sp.]|jgi:hypothetical protein|nr:hypothetical protein [Candidatus Sulfotelmatobacter sp.]